MKLAVLQEHLKRGIDAVGRAVASRSTLPVLSNILMRTEGGQLRLSATNLDIAISVLIPAKVADEGAITIPAELLSKLINNLPNDKIDLGLNERTLELRVTCGRSKTTVKGIDADEYPTLPGLGGEVGHVATFSPAPLRQGIGRVAFAAAQDDSRPVLQGVLLRLGPASTGYARMVATDGFRLAVAELDGVERRLGAEEDLSIPGKALIELSRLLSGDAPVVLSVTPTGGQAIFTVGAFTLTARLIDGRFPDYERIIPATHLTRTIVDVPALLGAVKRAALFAANSGNIIKITVSPADDLRPGTLRLSANGAEVGENAEEIDAHVQGEGGEIALNARHLQEAIGAVGGDQLVLETQTAARPGVFKPLSASEGYAHLVMPMSIR